jgi:hypothetical protein
LEKVYGWLSDTTPFNGVNSILLWVIILTITPYLHKPNALMLLMLIISPCTRYIAQYIDASSQLHAYKSHLALAAGLQQLKLAEQALSASCSITLKKAQCLSQDKEALLTAGPPHSMLGNTLFRANSLAQFLGFRSFRNLLIALPLLYAATTSPQEILRRGPSYIPSALLKCLLSSTISMVISYSFMYLIKKLDNYDNGAISLAQAHRQLANSQISFQTALIEIAKFNKAPEKP